jgi:hypothetical protein
MGPGWEVRDERFDAVAGRVHGIHIRYHLGYVLQSQNGCASQPGKARRMQQALLLTHSTGCRWPGLFPPPRLLLPLPCLSVGGRAGPEPNQPPCCCADDAGSAACCWDVAYALQCRIVQKLRLLNYYWTPPVQLTDNVKCCASVKLRRKHTSGLDVGTARLAR